MPPTLKTKARYCSLKPLILPFCENYQIDWPKEFARQAPLTVEIGFGTGDFLIKQAKENPGQNFIGLEYHWLPMRQTLRKIAVNNISNVRLVFANARVTFERLLKGQSLERVYALFPDPWFKKRHEKYRLFSRSFLRLVNNRLALGKGLEIVTDDFAYYDWILNQSDDTGFEIGKDTIEPRFSTKYEKKWFAKGQQQFYQLRLVKKQHIEILDKEEVPLRTFWTDDFNPEHFHPQNQSGAYSVAFKDFLYDAKLLKGMLHTIVSEENLTQQFWIAIKKLDKRWRITIADGCSVIPTASASQALNLVYEAVLESM